MMLNVLTLRENLVEREWILLSLIEICIELENKFVENEAIFFFNFAPFGCLQLDHVQ